MTDNFVWEESSVLKALNTFINPKSVNRIMNCLTNDSGLAKPLPLPLRNNTAVSKGFELQMGGLNSWYSVNLVEPQPQTSKYALRSSLGIGVCENNESACSSPFTASFGKEHLSSSEDLGGSGYVEVYFGNFSITSSSIVQMNLDSLYDLMLEQMRVSGCVLSTFTIEMTSLLIDIDQLVLVFVYPDGTNSTDDISDFAHTYLPLLSGRLLTLINDYISTQLSIAPETCDDGGVAPSGGDGVLAISPVDGGWKWQLSLITAASFLCLLIFIFHHRYLDYRKEMIKQDKETQENPGISDDHFFSSAIVCDRRIPLWFRVLFPISIAGTFGLFVYSNLSTDPVSVHAYCFVEGVALPPMTVFSFSLAGTVQDMWNARFMCSQR